jgi:hypothetical protein
MFGFCAWRAAALVILVFVLGACDRKENHPVSGEPAAINLSDGESKVVGFTRDVASRTITASVERGENIYDLSVMPATDLPAPGFAASLVAEDGSRFTVEFALDEASGRFWFREYTNVDELTGSSWNTDEIIYEEYVVNGQSFTTDYPNLGDEGLRRARNLHYHGIASSDLPAGVLDVGRAQAEYDAFYTSVAPASLNNNPTGEALMSLLGDPAFAAAVTGNTPDPLRIDTWDSRFCWAVTVCSRLKCGILGNPLCVPCVGATIACVVTEIICWFMGCGCCF